MEIEELNVSINGEAEMSENKRLDIELNINHADRQMFRF